MRVQRFLQGQEEHGKVPNNGRMQAYSAGNRIYEGNRSAPSIGGNNKAGYVARDNKTEVRKNLLQNLAKGKMTIGG